MATRKIKVLSTVGVSGTIETNVQTLGELKPLLRQREIDYNGMKMMVGETRNELSMDEARLPEGDFKLYLMPSKTKSGGGNIAETCFEIAELFETLGQQLAEYRRDNNTASEAKVKMNPEDAQDLADLRSLSGIGEDYPDDEESNDWA